MTQAIRLFAVTNKATNEEKFYNALNEKDAISEAAKDHFGVEEVGVQEAVDIGRKKLAILDTAAVTRIKTAKPKPPKAPAKDADKPGA